MYNHKTVEKKWQKYWAEHDTFKTGNDPKKKNYYALDMFPFPSGKGLHVGHPEGYTASEHKAIMCFIRWDGMHLVCQQSNML